MYVGIGRNFKMSCFQLREQTFYVWLFPFTEAKLYILARLFFVNIIINPSSKCMCKIYLAV